LVFPLVEVGVPEKKIVLGSVLGEKRKELEAAAVALEDVVEECSFDVGLMFQPFCGGSGRFRCGR